MEPFDLSGVGYVKRIIVGSEDPRNIRTEKEVQAAVDLLNRCLSEMPKGRIIGIEKTFSILSVGEHQVVLQCMIYHVGFERKPFWLD